MKIPCKYLYARQASVGINERGREPKVSKLDQHGNFDT